MSVSLLTGEPASELKACLYLSAVTGSITANTQCSSLARLLKMWALPDEWNSQGANETHSQVQPSFFEALLTMFSGDRYFMLNT
jgi:hypothetical protein